jgi:predicted SAM-dependent methyltransferase
MLPVGNEVIQCNFLNGIPFESNRFDLVYHSHVLEHFSKADGEKFIAECYRILKPGGVIRIALPNLEVIAKEYLSNIDRAMKGEENAEHDYDWIMLEMYDQTVRNQSGGGMLEYISKDKIPNEEYIFNRVGEGAKKWMPQTSNQTSKQSIISKVIQRPGLLLKGIRHLFVKSVLPGKDFQTYKVGQFRFGGEIHQWMYDRFSLGRLLKQVGFSEVMVRTATESYIDNWKEYKLDDPTENASLFIEAVK